MHRDRNRTSLTRHFISSLFAIAAVACSQSATPAAKTALLQGQVLAQSGQPSAGLSTTFGSSAVRTDASGHFSLSGAPDSGASLRLAGDGIDTAVAMPTIHAGVVASVTIRLGADGKGVIDGQPQAEIRGMVSSVADSELIVAGNSVRVDADTRLGGADASSLVGQVIDIRGDLQGNGAILARIISKQPASNGPGGGGGPGNQNVEIIGTIESISPPNLVVSGRQVVTDSKTSIKLGDKKATLASLAVGEMADVDGQQQADGSVLAKDIEATPLAVPPPAPIANAGPDQTVASGALVTLHGSVAAPTAVPPAFSWTQTAGAPVALAGANTANPSFTAPAVPFGAPPSVLVFTLVVTASGVGSAPSSVTITVNPAAPPAPIANAGADQTVASGALVTLDGSGSSDPAGLALTFAWTQAAGPAVTLSNAASATPGFIAPSVDPNLPAATLSFTLVVSDAFGSSAPASVTITVNPLPPPPPPPPAPIANAGANQTVDSGALVTLDGSASADPLGLALSFAWSQASGSPVSLTGADTASPSFTAPTVASGSLPQVMVFSLIVSDADGSSAPATVTVTVNPARPPPVANAGPDQTVSSGAQVILDGSASADPSGLPLSFSWSQTSGLPVSIAGASSATASFTAPSVPFGQPPAALVFSLTVSSAAGSSSAFVTITVNPVIPPPTANAGPDQAVGSGALVTLDGTASSDAAGLGLSFAWTQTAGPLVTLSDASSPSPSFTAPTVDSASPPQVLVFSLTVSDANGSSAPSIVTITVNPAPPVNQPPVANAGANQSVASGGLVTLDGTGSFDPEGQAITFAWTQTSGTIVALSAADAAQPTFTAPTVLAGSPSLSLAFELVVSDAISSSAPATVIVTVNPEAQNFPPPPGTPPPAPPNPNPPPNGGSGSNRFEMGASQGLYIADPVAGEPTVQGLVVVTFTQISGGNFTPPTDTVVTLNGVPLLRDPKLNGDFYRVDPSIGPQPVVGTGGQLILVATATIPASGNKPPQPIKRTVVLPCPTDIPVTSNPAVGSVVTAGQSVEISGPNITLNVNIPELAGIFPTMTLFGYQRATRALAGSGSPPLPLQPGPFDANVLLTPTVADAYLIDLRWPGIWIQDGQSGGFCGLAKRWTYVK
jgi:hypothetical protein